MENEIIKHLNEYFPEYKIKEVYTNKELLSKIHQGLRSLCKINCTYTEFIIAIKSLGINVCEN